VATIERVAPPGSLAHWVEHLWSVTWSLPEGEVRRSQVLTHPAVHLTVEWGPGRRHGVPLPAALVHGVVTRVFSVDLIGTGGVAGVRFRPGGFAAFTGRSATELTDCVRPVTDDVLPDADDLVDRATAAEGTTERLAALADALARHTPDPDPVYDELLAVVTLMLEDPALTTVADVSSRTGLSVRTLQRSFRRYVGVGPKWVLQRYRLQDAVARLDAGEVHDLAGLAAELGWYDQAHFSRDFAESVGVPPGRYLRRSPGDAT